MCVMAGQMRVTAVTERQTRVCLSPNRRSAACSVEEEGWKAKQRASAEGRQRKSPRRAGSVSVASVSALQ
eukprot:3672033-Rhodomonas_salina.1